MDTKKLNPLVWLNAGINAALDKVGARPTAQIDPTPTPAPAPSPDPATPPTSQPETLPVPVDPAMSPVPVDESAKEGTIIRGRFSEQPDQDAAMRAITTIAAQRTDQFRQEAESFDDEKASLAEKSLRFVFTAFAYLVPITLAVFIGLAVGDAFTPPGSTSGYSAYAHFLSIALEMSMPILGFCVALTFRRAAKDRSQVALCGVFTALFLAVGIGNAIVQIFMVTQNIGALNVSDQAAVYFRAAAPLIIDLISTLYLSVTGAKSLKRYLADKRAVMEAVRDISGVNILLEGQQNQAALNQLQAMMDMQSKQQRAHTWNKLEAIQAEKMIRNAERAMQQEDDNDSSSGAWRRRRY